MEIFLQSETWIALLTLTFLEIVLGIDNIIFITIVSDKLPEAQQKRARNIGFILAMVLRIIMLFGISYLLAMEQSLFSFATSAVEGSFTGQSIILIIGGLFLLYKSTTEIFRKVEGKDHAEVAAEQKARKKASVGGIIVQIALINIVFSFDSILTAIGLTDLIPVMVIAVVLSVIVMMAFAGPVGRFVNKHPSFQVLGLAFLILIGFMLITEGLHLAHFVIFHEEVGSIPKGYLYFAIFFSFIVELINMRVRRKGSKS